MLIDQSKCLAKPLRHCEHVSSAVLEQVAAAPSDHERGAAGDTAEGIDNSGRYNQNPSDISLLGLLREDFVTHDRSLAEAGFWVIALHRLGNARMDVRVKLLRAPLTVLYRITKAVMGVLWGIDLSYTTKLGRRVRIWHYGSMVLGARAIGDGVTLRQDTTFGLLHQGDTAEKKPIIGNGVDVGSGVAVLGQVRVGDDATIGANSVVVKDVSPGATVFGVPARPVDLGRLAAGSVKEKQAARDETEKKP